MANNRIILAVDPGLATGLAVLESSVMRFNSHEVKTPKEFYDWIQWFFESPHHPTHIVCESYIITPETIKKSRQNYSLELIGVLKYLAWERELPFTLQTPIEGKSFGTDEKLKTIGWYRPSQGHANDAARHLLTYCVQNKIIDPAELLV